MKYFSARTLCSIWMRLFFLLLFFACGSPNNSSENSSSNTLENTSQKKSQLITRSLGLKVFHGDVVVAESKSNMRCAVSDYMFAPLGKELNSAILSTSAYLKGNPDECLNIEGLYEAQELNNSVLPSLGLARAISMKQIFMAYGVSAERIVLNSREERRLPIRSGFLVGSIALNIIECSDESSRLLEIENALLGKSKSIYPGKVEGEIELNPELREYFSDLLSILYARPKMRITLTGCTDNRGELASQRARGLNSADKLKRQLVKSGFVASQIITTTKGAEKPIASNGTAEGRALNERVEIFIED